MVKEIPRNRVIWYIEVAPNDLLNLTKVNLNNAKNDLARNSKYWI